MYLPIVLTITYRVLYHTIFRMILTTK